MAGARLYGLPRRAGATRSAIRAFPSRANIAERSSPEAVMATLRRHRPTIFFGVPTLFANILANPGLGRLAGSDRLCASAEEALPENVSRRWMERFGVEILDAIGSTEALYTFISNRPNDIRYGTSGKPVPGWEVRLLDENGREAGAGEPGNLWCSGPTISPGYWNNREVSQRNFVGRWLRTGDTYLRDRDGYYHYLSRADDMLKSGGIWVSPFEVESVLIAHPEVLQAAVIGVPDSEGLSKPKAFVVLREGVSPGTDKADALKAFVRERLAHFKCPRAIEFRAALPMTATGKIQRYKLREEAMGTAAGSPAT